MSRPPRRRSPETAAQKARMAETPEVRDPGGWRWLLRDSAGATGPWLRERAALHSSRKWAGEYRLIKDLWAFDANRIAVRFQYEWQRCRAVYRSYGNEQWEFGESDCAPARASINDFAIAENDRRFHWAARPRPADGAGLAGVDLERDAETGSERPISCRCSAKCFAPTAGEGATLARGHAGRRLARAAFICFFPGGKQQMAAEVLDEIDRWFRSMFLDIARK